MKTIWKYTLGPTHTQTLDIPRGFRIRHVGPPSPTAATVMGVCIWVEVDDTADKVPVDFYLAGTGHIQPSAGIYCGTAVMGDQYVWHVYMAARL